LKRTLWIAAILIIALSAINDVYSQVDKVKKASRANNKSKSSGNDYSSSGADDFFAGVEGFFNIVEGIFLAQEAQLMRKKEEPWLVSLEGNLYNGYYSKNNNLLFLPSLRANWGLFSTSLRLNRMQDNTGFFKTLDWQAIILNIVNRPVATFRLGIGISKDFEVDDTYTEHFFGLDLHFNQRKINPTIEFRIAKDYQTDATPRIEWNTRVDFLLMNIGKVDVNLMGGLLYQRYFSSVNFFFIQTGVSFSFY